MFEELDIANLLTWEDGLPRPQWDLLHALIESQGETADRRALWTNALRQWLAELAAGLGPDYYATESENFLAIAWRPDQFGDGLLYVAEKCRAALLSALDGIAHFDVLGQQVIVAMRDEEDYYRYVSVFYPEGVHGSSAGLHIRDGYPHVALHGRQWPILENTLAHELTHVSLHHRSMPQWLEEGLAQMFEHDVTNRALLVVDGALARQHKRYWSHHGLDEFWRGSSFSRRGKVQNLSYQLAEILVRLLVEDAKPRWFGWDRGPQRKLLAFLKNARASDCGGAAICEHLGSTLSEIAARFLGPGDWMPML